MSQDAALGIAVVTVSGVYSVTVTNMATGCSSTTTTTVSSNTVVPTVSITPSSTTLTCQSPLVTLTANGTGALRWNTTETTSTIAVSMAKTYSVTLTDANGCTAVATQIIDSNTTPPIASILTPASSTLTCTTTSISLTATGGGTYYWEDNSTSAVRTVSTAGTYSVTLTGANGCTATISSTVSADQSAPSLSITPSSLTLICSTPSVTLTANGVGTLLWSTTATSSQITVNIAGTYSVTLTAASGCTATTSVTILSDQQAPSVSIMASNTTLTCAITSVTLTATGGGTYRWEDNSTNAIRMVSASGTYSVTVTGANGCSATATTTISSNTVLSIAAGASLPMANVGVVISLTASGATTYQWTAPATASFTTPATSSGVLASLNTAGVQTFTVVATTGACSQSALVSVTALAGPDLSPLISLPDANFAVVDSKGLLIQLQEVNGSVASGNIIITLTVPTGYSVSFDNTLTSFDVSGGSRVMVANSKWHVSNTVSNRQLSLTINGGESVGPTAR
ncbi:hypothetical protein HMF3257_30865 [Spirosoma telluris]|uniref:Ig-like domain-containing protein n=1 Tax=Spirosoma telluris TaxID=2183553 RepID=A0A327NUF5_9BACT|nr:hypothetical protein HMF3257_30865 [Spirosoma telluris]